MKEEEKDGGKEVGGFGGRIEIEAATRSKRESEKAMSILAAAAPAMRALD